MNGRSRTARRGDMRPGVRGARSEVRVSQLQPPVYPFVVQPDRRAVTDEPDPSGIRHDRLNPGLDWIGYRNMGGGHVPEDLVWPTNPKERQEEVGHG
jgi:hypothetical protein